MLSTKNLASSKVMLKYRLHYYAFMQRARSYICMNFQPIILYLSISGNLKFNKHAISMMPVESRGV